MLDNLTSVPSDEREVVGVSSSTPAARAPLLGSSNAPVAKASTGKPRDPPGEEGGNGHSPWETTDDTGGEGVDNSSTRRKGKGKVGAAGATANPRASSRSSSSASSAGGGGKDSRARSALGDEDIDIGEEGGAAGGGDEGDARLEAVSAQARRNDDESMDDPLESKGVESGTHARQQEQTPEKKGKGQGKQHLPRAEGDDAPTPALQSASGSTRKRKRPEALPLPQQKAPRGNQYNLWSGAILRKVCVRVYQLAYRSSSRSFVPAASTVAELLMYVLHRAHIHSSINSIIR